MAKVKVKEYDPNAEYVCVKGTLSIRDVVTKTPMLITPESVDEKGNQVRFKLPNRTPGQIAYLVDGLKKVALASSVSATGGNS